MTKKANKIKAFFLNSDILTVRDYHIMAFLCIIFTFLVFFRIGNTYAPQTSYYTDSENRDIIIDFGDYVSVAQLHIYLGNLDNRKVAVSAFNEVTGAWELINDELSASSVFQWNSLNIYYNLRYLGIVSLDEEAVFQEFVFTDLDGNVLTPVNAFEYETLFDEQEDFYDTYEKTYMDGTMFDEVYHGRTGYEFVHGLPTYETTHPQLGKCIIALGIKMFGMTPFGMRFFSALFGIAFIPLMYIFAKRLFNNTLAAVSVGVFIAFDCMHYTLSRIATIDIYVAFFIVASYYFMYKYIVKDTEYRKNVVTDKFPPSAVYMPLGCSGIMMGLAVATKLTGVYAGIGLAVILTIHLIKYPPRKQTFRLFCFCFVFFIIFTLCVYTLAYIPAVEAYAQLGITDKTIKWDENGLNIGYGYTGLLARTARNTNYMINYHKNLVAEHYYQSPFYEWPVVWMPLLAANDSIDGGDLVSSVSYMGNLAVWWVEIPCVIYTIIIAIRNMCLMISNIFRKENKCTYDVIPMFLALAYLAQYIPWMKVSRITFIYHYLPSALFGMLILGYVIKQLTDKFPKAKIGVYVYLGVVVLIFGIFFPVISGVPVSKEYGMSLRWLRDWILVL